jgi:hypothetical protein
MKEQQTIARITRNSFKQREGKFLKISKLEEEKKGYIATLEQRQRCIDVHIDFYNTCHQLPYKELLAHRHVGVLLNNGLIIIHEIGDNGLTWKPWSYDASEYFEKLQKHELHFHIPVRKQLITLIEGSTKHTINPIKKKINTIDRRIEKLRQDISAIQSIELHKISVEEAFMSDDYINIFKDMNLSLFTLSNKFGNVIKHDRFITPNIVCECVRVMRKFNESRMLQWTNTCMDVKYDGHSELTDAYLRIQNVFKILSRIEKFIAKRVKRGNPKMRIEFIISFIKEIIVFKRNFNKMWVSFYVSNIPQINKSIHFSDNLVQHIYEYIFGIDKILVKVIDLPQPRTLIA